jgi:hypothetical protein
MARNLHHKLAGIGRRWWPLAAAWLLVVGLPSAGCGPLEADQPEQGPPHIGRVEPTQPIYQVSGTETNVQLRAVLYDPNRHDELHVAWFGSETGFILDSQTAREAEVRYQGGDFHRYEEVTQTVDPCESGETRGRETFWLYVSDRPFASLDGRARSVEAAEEAFVVSHSWVLDYVCQ